MKPALRGKRARWLGSLDQPHTLNYLEDMARAVVTLGERDEADGEVWHLPAAEPLTGRQFLTVVFEAAGHPPKLGVASRPMIRIAGLFNPLLRELAALDLRLLRLLPTDRGRTHPESRLPVQATLARSDELAPARGP
jgi:nucleoside-diphosphate-sugar epimerase